MRTYYIFNINKDLSIITKEIPYNLYKMIENMYYNDTLNYGISFNMFNNLFNSINIDYVNTRINNLFKDNKYYTYNKDDRMHIITNKYKPEYSVLKVYNRFIKLDSNTIKPSILFNYLSNNDLFVCDFKNKDYFWLTDLVK